MEPITLIALGIGLYMVLKKPQKGAVTSRTRIVVSADCANWDLPDAWFETVAQKRWEAFLEKEWKNPLDPPEEGEHPSSWDWTEMILKGEVPANCSLPRRPDLQTDDPSGWNYWNGPPAMLALFQHVHDFVLDAAERWVRSAGTDKRFAP